MFLSFRWFVAASTLAALTSLGACASSPELRQRPIQGSVADRMLAIQESMFALIAKSHSSDEAADRITQYCEDERAAIEQLAADSEAMSGAEMQAMADDLTRRSQKLIDRASEALEDRVHVMTDGRVIVAMARCRTPPVAPPSAPTSTEDAPTSDPEGH